MKLLVPTPTAIGLAVVTALCSVLAAPAGAATLLVPETYSTISQAVAQCSSGDTISVGPGTYLENISTNGMAIAFIARSGRNVTTIDGREMGPAVQVAGGVLHGFTITNGKGEGSLGGGVHVAGNQPMTIEECTITGNAAPNGAGIYVASTAVTTIVDCTVTNNIAGTSFPDAGDGGGVYVSQRSKGVVIMRVDVLYNIAGDSGGGIYQEFQLPPLIVQQCHIAFNACHVEGGGVAVNAATCSANLIDHNQSAHRAGGVAAAYSDLLGNTISNNVALDAIPGQPTGVYALGCTLHNNIISNSLLPPPLEGGTGIVINGGTVSCNDWWGNSGRQVVIVAPYDSAGAPNVSIDPQYCETTTYRLQSSSPCLTGACGQIGAEGVGCDVTEVRRASWGALKQRYR